MQKKMRTRSQNSIINLPEELRRRVFGFISFDEFERITYGLNNTHTAVLFREYFRARFDVNGPLPLIYGETIRASLDTFLDEQYDIVYRYYSGFLASADFGTLLWHLEPDIERRKILIYVLSTRPSRSVLQESVSFLMERHEMTRLVHVIKTVTPFVDLESMLFGSEQLRNRFMNPLGRQEWEAMKNILGTRFIGFTPTNYQEEEDW